VKVFQAGCGRERQGPDDLHELAYTALEYPECPDCPHRLEPEGAPSFCRWLSGPRPQPFAVLADFVLPDEVSE
jgi:hypothetical protein